MFSSLPRDVQQFLAHYPGSPDDKRQSANLEFYTNKRRCQPDDLFVTELHEQWKGDYNRLEREHGYVQWLFPIQEPGMNYLAQPLQRHEIEAIKADPEAVKTVLGSYRLMLDFYGMQLLSEETGLLARTEGAYERQYYNLISRPHNYLRISRILKCLSEFGLEHLNAGFLLHVLNEQSEHQQLDESYLKSSMDRWWANCIRDEGERLWIGAVIKEVRRGEIVFTRSMYERSLERRRQTGTLSFDESQSSGEQVSS